MENEGLADHQFMTLLTPDRQRALRSLGRPQRFRAGDTLLHTGQVGDRVIRMTRYAPPNPVALYEPGHALVLGGINDNDERLQTGRPTSTWAFIVDPVGAQRCRLIVRSRASAPGARLQGPIKFVMQHRMMGAADFNALMAPRP